MPFKTIAKPIPYSEDDYLPEHFQTKYIMSNHENVIFLKELNLVVSMPIHHA